MKNNLVSIENSAQVYPLKISNNGSMDIVINIKRFRYIRKKPGKSAFIYFKVGYVSKFLLISVLSGWCFFVGDWFLRLQ